MRKKRKSANSNFKFVNQTEIPHWVFVFEFMFGSNQSYELTSHTQPDLNESDGLNADIKRFIKVAGGLG